MNYHDLLAAVALRINALGDGGTLWPATDAAQLQVVYTQRPLTNEMFGSSIFSFNSQRDAILNAEQKLAEAIALSGDRSLRAYILSETAALGTGDELPSVGTNSKQIIGNFGAVLDGEDGTVLTRQPIALVRNRLLTTGVFLVPAYYYALASGRIIHTREEVVIECCIYDHAAQVLAFDSNEAILLPDTLAEACINGALAMLVRDDEFVQQAALFAGYFAAALATIPRATMEAQAV